MPTTYFKHETAVIDEGAQIGIDTKVWHFCHIMPKAIVGNNCILGQNVFVGDNVKVGNNVKIQNNVSLYEGVICEDDVFIGPSAVFTNVINPKSTIEKKHEFKSTLIKKGVTIGANATIVCGVEIGNYAFVGAGSVVTKNVSNFALVYGNPAKQKGWVSQTGEKLKFDANNECICNTTKTKYKLQNNIVIIIE